MHGKPSSLPRSTYNTLVLRTYISFLFWFFSISYTWLLNSSSSSQCVNQAFKLIPSKNLSKSSAKLFIDNLPVSRIGRSVKAETNELSSSLKINVIYPLPLLHVMTFEAPKLKSHCSLSELYSIAFVEIVSAIWWVDFIYLDSIMPLVCHYFVLSMLTVIRSL